MSNHSALIYMATFSCFFINFFFFRFSRMRTFGQLSPHPTLHTHTHTHTHAQAGPLHQRVQRCQQLHHGGNLGNGGWTTQQREDTYPDRNCYFSLFLGGAGLEHRVSGTWGNIRKTSDSHNMAFQCDADVCAVTLIYGCDYAVSYVPRICSTGKHINSLPNETYNSILR